MNIIASRSNFADANDPLSQVRDRALSMREVLDLYQISVEMSGNEAPKGFIAADTNWLDRAELFLLPTFPGDSRAVEIKHEKPPIDSSLWLEGHYLDEDKKEIVAFPNEADESRTSLMLFARLD